MRKPPRLHASTTDLVEFVSEVAALARIGYFQGMKRRSRPLGGRRARKYHPKEIQTIKLLNECAAILLAAAGLASGTCAGRETSGVTVNVMTCVGPQIAEPLPRFAHLFGKLTGSKVTA